MKGGGLFAFAGLWDRWEGPGGPVESCAVITTAANALVEPIHDRMPVILDRSAYEVWLDAGTRPWDLQRLLAPYPADAMEGFAVSPRVNRADVDDPECAQPVAAGTSSQGQLSLF